MVIALSMLAAAQFFAGITFAAEPQVPVLWDAKERLPKPDLSALPRLRFLTTTDFPPFNFLDSAGKLSGFHVDLARAICAELGIAEKCQIQALPWGELDEALQKGEGEAIIAGIAATPETRTKYAFSRSYLQFPARFIMPKAKAFAEPILDKLRSKRVGVIAGSAHEKMLREYFGTVQVVPFDAPEALYGDLKSGKIDAAFGDGMRFAFWLGGTDAAGCCRFAGGPYLAPEYLGSGMAIATRAGDPALAAAMDYALQEISVKGTFAEFYLRYFPVSFF
ncbi:transporter substrate-binding domain-containing protein [Mesorhizobium abyssinicae]|uniref:Transporter substrate-binding domain-containing protein n=3 Tax=Mesorhizobium TaxID=68287 RepID=A0ABU5AI69_9HYPH|nr:transporter substrate-binding domain-containing protein [Mesorhizobium abyssinicae]MDX8536980.1 transporter substrate-binding domain-containing protein [Mesorhizobium abyssinicae]